MPENENADLMRVAGGGSAEIKALYEITPLMGIQNLLGGNTKAAYVKGDCQDPKKENQDVDGREKTPHSGACESQAENRCCRACLVYMRTVTNRRKIWKELSESS